MQKDDLVLFGLMLDTSEKAVSKVSGPGRDDFDANENLRLGLVHLIQTIGEVARRVSEAFRAAHPQISWTQIVGIRHKLVHDYLHVDFDVVWGVATHDLPLLVSQLRLLVP